MDIVQLLTEAGLKRGVSLKIQGTVDEPLFSAGDVGKLLGLANIRESMKHFSDDDAIQIPQIDTMGRNTKMTFLKRNGLKRLLANSRKPVALELSKMLGMHVFECKIACYEAKSLQAIMKAFDGEEMLLQYGCGCFKIDLFFPHYKLAIECDENNANHRNVKGDLMRQSYIEDHLKCTFIRYKPDAPDYCIFGLINRIRMHMKSYKYI